MRSILFLALALCFPAMAAAQDRETVVFEINQETNFGQSVFVLGDIPELGAGDLRRAIKLEPSAYPVWRAGVDIPAGVSFTYRYYVRADGPRQTAQASNGTPVTAELTANVDAEQEAAGKAIVVRAADIEGTYTLHHRGFRDAAFQTTPLQRLTEGTAPGTAEFFALRIEPDHASDAYGVEFFIEGPGGFRSPAAGTHTALAPGVFVQEDQVFTYRPAESVSPARRDYNPANPPRLFANAIGEQRGYRVYLPRGYDEHTGRAYPLVIFHDGQNVFESGPFGSWNADDAIKDTTNAGLVREAVYVGIDNADRFRDYIPGLGANNYIAFLTDQVIPHIQANYRVRTDADNVAAIGSSLGGVISMEMGWNHPDDFGLVGALSGAWQVTTASLNPQLRNQPKRDIRIYMDSGDSGTADDNYWLTYGLRDALVGTAAPRYGVGGDLLHVVGFGDFHNEAAWDRRMPGVLRYLLPSRDDENGVLADVVGPQLDRNRDGEIDPEDMYIQEEAAEDLNRDGAIDDADRDYQRRVVRRKDEG